MNFAKRPKCIVNSRHRLATIPSRILAMTLDVIITILLMLAILLLMVALGVDINLNVENLIASHVELEVESSTLNKHITDCLKLFFGFFPVIYFFLTTYITNGQSLGKKLVGIKIVSLYHRRLSIWHCLERSLGYIASTLELGLGFFQILWNPNRMALHDKIGETVVIKLETVRKSQQK
jgi:uncharacterized RDD family membrane protein YckC